MRDIIMEVLKLVIMIAVFLITKYAIPWLKAQTDNEIMTAVVEWTTQAVLAAEQIHGSEDGAKRKYIVTQFIKKILEAKNLAISDEELNILIEAAVKQMNDAQVNIHLGQEKGEEHDMETRSGV